MRRISLLVMLLVPSSALADDADICIYDGTSGGAAAALQAARMGRSVVLVESGKHICRLGKGEPAAVIACGLGGCVP